MAVPAKLMEVCDDILVFDDVMQRNDPYLHILSPQFYSDRFADTLLTWMENNQDWNHHNSLHYQQYELGFTRFTHCKEIEGLWDGSVLAEIRDRASRAFGVPLSGRINISAHKMVPGQYGYIHTDKIPHETHRVVVTLNRGRPADSGGNLVLLSGSKPADVAVVLKQISNTACGFALDSKSFHAITQVKTDTRFTVIYTFLSDAVLNVAYPGFFTAS